MKQHTISSLAKLISPPLNPVDPPSAKAWKRIEKEVGITFPQDYFELMATYGSGLFRQTPSLDFLHFYNPAAPWYLDSLREIHELYRDLKTNSVGGFRYDIFPKKKGVFYIGSSENRIAVFYLINDEPDNWPILVWRPDQSWARMNLGLVPFLAQLFSGALRAHFKEWVFANESAYTSIRFEPEEIPPTLHELVLENNATAIRSLVSSGSDVNSPDPDGRTPLMLARNGKIIRLLLSLGANANIADKVGLTPLMSAAKLSLALESLKLLLRAGANVNTVDAKGWSPLMYAVASGNVDSVVLLLDHKADVNLRTKKNETAVLLAAGMPKIQKLLRAKGAVE